jgi:hypothetical protein
MFSLRIFRNERSLLQWIRCAAMASYGVSRAAQTKNRPVTFSRCEAKLSAGSQANVGNFCMFKEAHRAYRSIQRQVSSRGVVGSMKA